MATTSVTTGSDKQEKSITVSSMDITQTDKERSTLHLSLPSSDDSDDDQQAPTQIEPSQTSQAASFVPPASMRTAEASYSAFHATSDKRNENASEDSASVADSDLSSTSAESLMLKKESV